MKRCGEAVQRQGLRAILVVSAGQRTRRLALVVLAGQSVSRESHTTCCIEKMSCVAQPAGRAAERVRPLRGPPAAAGSRQRCAHACLAQALVHCGAAQCCAYTLFAERRPGPAASKSAYGCAVAGNSTLLSEHTRTRPIGAEGEVVRVVLHTAKARLDWTAVAQVI